MIGLGWVSAALFAAFALHTLRRYVRLHARLVGWQRRWVRSREVCSVCLRVEADAGHIEPGISVEAWERHGLKGHYYEPARIVAVYGDTFTLRDAA